MPDMLEIYSILMLFSTLKYHGTVFAYGLCTSEHEERIVVTYSFDGVLGQQVSFNPSVDLLLIENGNATQFTFTTQATTLTVRGPQGFVILDATPLLTKTDFGVLTPANIRFSDGSVVAVGDLTTNDTLDSGNNAINFVTNTSLNGALNKNNQIFGLDGADAIDLTGSGANHLIFGGKGADTITSGNGNSTLYGGQSSSDTTDGSDTFIIGSGSNVIYGNAGADLVSFSNVTGLTNTLTFYGGLGADSITATSSSGTFEIYGGPDSDQIRLVNGSGNSTIYGGLGTDTIDMSGSIGNHTIYGGNGEVDAADGNDVITLGSGNTLLYANGGADVITANASAGRTATLYLGAGADSLTSAAAAGNYVIFGGSGSENINLTNHTGNATIYGGGGQFDAGDGADTIVGSSSGNNIIFGNGGADVITVRPGNGQSATVYGGAGNDTISATPGHSSATTVLFGHSGIDQFNVNFSSASATVRIADFGTEADKIGVTLSGGAGATSLEYNLTDTTTTFTRSLTGERIIFDNFTGNFGANQFILGDKSVVLTNFNAAAASLAGTAFSDFIMAGNSGDSIAAGAGADKLIGGLGNDTFVFKTAEFTLDDVVSAGGGTDILTLETPGTAIIDDAFRNVSGVETLKLASGDFGTNGITLGSLASAAGIRTVDASGASKVLATLTGMQQGVTYNGGTDVDSITGSNNNDVIDGKAGNDVMIGNRGNDTLTGGAGSDIFIYNTGTIEGIDIITDMDFGTSTTSVDKLRFSSGSAAYNLGNQDTILDGAIINSITSAGAQGTEIIILRDVGIATANIRASLDIINADASALRGILNIFYDTTLGHVVMYYDGNGSQSGSQAELLKFTSLTSLSDMGKVDFTDFSFV